MRAQPSTEPSPHAPQRHSIDASLKAPTVAVAGGPPPQAAVNGATEGKAEIPPALPRRGGPSLVKPLRDPTKIQQDHNDGAHGAVEL